MHVKKPAPTPGVYETKLVSQPFELETLADSTGEFSGKAIMFDSQHPTSSWMLGDGWKDQVSAGAFKESLSAQKPLMLFMHSRDDGPIGVWTDVRESKSALEVRGKVSPDAVTPRGVKILDLMKSGGLTGLSIGFRPTAVTLDEKSKLRTISKVDLSEISVVDIPGAGPTARITDVKLDPRGLEASLRAFGFSRNEAKAIIARDFERLVHPAALAALNAEQADDEGKEISLPAVEVSSAERQIHDSRTSDVLTELRQFTELLKGQRDAGEHPRDAEATELMRGLTKLFRSEG